MTFTETLANYTITVKVIAKALLELLLEIELCYCTEVLDQYFRKPSADKENSNKILLTANPKNLTRNLKENLF